MEGDNKPALVALRDRRERVIDALSQRFTSDEIGLDEYEKRLDLAHRADTVATLDALLADLTPALEPTTALAVRHPQTLDAPRPEKRRVMAIFGGAQRQGDWTVPKQLRVVAVFGGIELDFREAVLPPGETHVHVTAMFGGVQITVPPNLAVEADGTAIFGGFEKNDEIDRVPQKRDPAAPRLRISGLVTFGGCEIRTRLVGESNREAKKRVKRERAALAQGAAPKQLPKPGHED